MATIKIPPPCFSFLNAEMIESEKGKSKVRFTPTEEMENPYGVIQGGLLAGMLDNCIGPAAVSVAPARKTTTVNMNVSYLRPVKAGQSVIGYAEVVKHGRTQAFIEARLVLENDGDILAKASATNIFLD